MKYHKLPEVKEAKDKEYLNLKEYETFDKVDDKGQDKIGSRWVITKKEKHDRQKTQYKARLVAKGFQETMKPQSDSPTALRESLKVFLAVSANMDFEIASLDIRAAFLQAHLLGLFEQNQYISALHRSCFHSNSCTFSFCYS